MRLNRMISILFVLALVAVPAAADCGAPHEAAATEAKACCTGAAEGTGCSADCPHATEALRLAEAAENGDQAAMEKLVSMIKESGHDDAITLAGKAEGGCEASRATLIAMVKEHVGGQTDQPVSMTQLAKAAGGGCSKSTAGLIAAAKKSDDEKMVELATAAEGGCQHSKEALIAMVTEQDAPEEQ